MGFFTDLIENIFEESGENLEKFRTALRGCAEEEQIVRKPDC